MNRAGRYAPSPTGELHLGNLRTALVAWLAARSQGARFLLRVEDLDRERSRERFVDSQLGDLRALGLEWDEPERLLRQSERDEAYAEAIAKLRADGLIYECFCTRREIREAPSAPHDNLPEDAYPGTCRELTAAQRAERQAAGRPAALRVRAGGAQVSFSDRLAGERNGAVDDFVVRRGDGNHAYNLAVSVDDAAQGIGEVVRGRDLLESTPRQVWIAERLDLTAPASWIHVPLVLGDDGKRLAKRHGAVTLAARRELGEAPEATLAMLARSLDLCGADERPPAAELVGRFDLDRLPRDDAPLGELAG